MPGEIMAAGRVAEPLQVSRDMMWQPATRGELPVRKVRRIWRFSREAIDEFMREGVTKHPGGHASGGLLSRVDNGLSYQHDNRPIARPVGLDGDVSKSSDRLKLMETT